MKDESYALHVGMHHETLSYLYLPGNSFLELDHVELCSG